MPKFMSVDQLSGNSIVGLLSCGLFLCTLSIYPRDEIISRVGPGNHPNLNMPMQDTLPYRSVTRRLAIS